MYVGDWPGWGGGFKWISHRDHEALLFAPWGAFLVSRTWPELMVLS